jgi:hypothetical protein
MQYKSQVTIESQRYEGKIAVMELQDPGPRDP